LRFQIGAEGQPTSQRTEPIAADAREGKDGKANAKLKLIAGLLDVGFDALKQRELQRRNRRLAIVTAAALLALAITTTLAITAVIARNDAERRQKQAEDLVGFMLGDLNDKLAQVNRLDIIESVDDKAMEYFKSLPTSDVTDEALAQRAKALQRIGTVRQDQGHLPAALESYESALKLISAQAQAMPHDIGRQIAHAENVSFIGMAHWFQGDLDAAARDFTSARTILVQAEQLDGTNTEVLRQKLIAEGNLGHVRESQGDLESALASYQSGLDLAQRLVAAKPDNVTYVTLLGSAHNDLGKLALIRGDLVTAVAEYSADDKIEADLGARDPSNNDQRENVFRVRAILGRTLALVGDTEGAIRRLREAVDIAAQLEKQDPTITSIRENGALYKAQLSRLLRLSGSATEASKLTNEALETFAELVRQDSTNTAWQRKLAEARSERSAQLLSTGSAQEARKLLESALAWLEPALESQPNDRDTVLAAVNARLLLATADETRASKLRETCLASITGVPSGANDPRLLALKANTLLGLNRKSEALSVVERLRTSGYRDPAFAEVMLRSDIVF
jgi:tetratricopeptide (TPR) repeat protein